MPCSLLATGTAKPNPRPREVDMCRIYVEWNLIGRQLPEDGNWSYSRRLLGGLQTRVSSEYSDDGNSSGVESAGLQQPHFTSLLSRPAGNQLPVLSPAAHLRALPAHIYARVHNGGWYLRGSNPRLTSF